MRCLRLSPIHSEQKSLYAFPCLFLSSSIFGNHLCFSLCIIPRKAHPLFSLLHTGRCPHILIELLSTQNLTQTWQLFLNQPPHQPRSLPPPVAWILLSLRRSPKERLPLPVIHRWFSMYLVPRAMVRREGEAVLLLSPAHYPAQGARSPRY